MCTEPLIKFCKWLYVRIGSFQPFLCISGGYYTVKTKHGLRIVALNTNLYYTSNKAILNELDPADQLQWLNTTLFQAKTNNDKVSTACSIYYTILYALNLKF